MFSGDMLLNPQIFGRVQSQKRSKHKRGSHRFRHKNNSSAGSTPTHKSGGRTTPSKQLLGDASCAKPKQTRHDADSAKLKPDAQPTGAVKHGKVERKPKERYRVEMKVDSESERASDNKKRPLPGKETRQQLMDMLLEDEYYRSVVCEGHLPAKELVMGALYLLLLLAIDAYVQMAILSMVLATCAMLLLFLTSRS